MLQHAISDKNDLKQRKNYKFTMKGRVTRMLKIYMDNCCYNRPYDDQTQLKVSLQTQAKLQIQKEALIGECELVWSYLLDFENSANPYEFKRNAIQEWEHVAKEMVVENEEIIELSNQLKSHGLKTKDALHVACAIYAKADYFITTDDKVLNKNIGLIDIISPIDYISRKGAS